MSYLENARARIRDAVFAMPVVGTGAQRVRATMMERSYERLRRVYEGRGRTAGDTTTLLRRVAGDRLAAFATCAGRPHVLWVGTDEFQDRAGILQGLEAVADVTPFVQANGVYGQLTSSGDLSQGLRRSNGERLLELLAAAEAGGTPVTIIIGQMWSGFMDASALRWARDEHGVLVVNVSMDDRHAFRVRKLGRSVGTSGLIGSIDLAATAAPEVVDWYRHEGCPAVFFPEASDPELYRPDAGTGKRHDVSFVGMRYGIRRRIVETLEAAGIRVTARGRGWPAGRMAPDGVGRFFAESKIVLGIGTIGYSERFYALKMRDFDATMSGSCYVTHANPDLALLFDVGSELEVYRDDDECVAVVQALLADDERREAIGRRGRERCLRDHTWRQRFDDMFRILRDAA